MRKTYVTTMPDEAGAFLKACRCFAELHMNITRVSYNKAVDTHTLFLEAEGTPEQFRSADEQLEKLGYIADSRNPTRVMLLEFKLDDRPGALAEMLSLIERYGFNISYISSYNSDLGYHPYRMGLFVEDPQTFPLFLKEAQDVCPVTNVQYDNTEVTYDNSIFYSTYVDQLAANAELPEEQKPRLAVYVNRVMELLHERNLSPKVAFDCIAKFAAHVAKYKGSRFCPRISTVPITDDSSIILIEPPCGSNTTILQSGGEFLFIDTGYGVYEPEMRQIFDVITGGFDQIRKRALLTHADVDHVGLLHLFDEIYTSDKSKKSLELEYRGKRSFREQNPIHIPYVKICRLLTGNQPTDPRKITVICSSDDEQHAPLYRTGTFDFGEFHFDVYYGQGGHLSGEIVLVENTHRLIFSGDIYFNLRGCTPEQAEYNRYAPILLTTVDTNPALSKMERNALLKLAENGEWTIFGGHGAPRTVKNGEPI